MRLVALTAAFAFACSSKPADPPPHVASGSAVIAADARVDDPNAVLATKLAAIRADKKLPAVAAALWTRGKLLAIAAVGDRKQGDAAHTVTVDDRWHLGSNTKAMTALVIARHVERGTLHWTDTLDKLFPGTKLDPAYRRVTLAQLLQHTGGMPANPPDDAWQKLWADGTSPDARSTFVRAALREKPEQAPGTFVYSNTGYIVAGTALERATGQRWEDLMKRELFEPLGMTSCGFGAPGKNSDVDQPWGHAPDGSPVAPGHPQADNPPGLGPAGTVHCSLADYGKFLAVVLAGARGDPQPLLKPETFTTLLTPVGGTYAGGWIVKSTSYGKVLGHSGSNTMWFATALIFPDSQVIAVIATNTGDTTLESALVSLLDGFTK
ncbi:MAG TPA: serine hydrolase domain-containing protein [Kofleriaceae bacterium]|nr:serine hydrolase domain-containing protein [Kofleriaceae bacterium]